MLPDVDSLTVIMIFLLCWFSELWQTKKMHH